MVTHLCGGLHQSTHAVSCTEIVILRTRCLICSLFVAKNSFSGLKLSIITRGDTSHVQPLIRQSRSRKVKSSAAEFYLSSKSVRCRITAAINGAEAETREFLLV